MPTAEFEQRIERLKAELVNQGRLVERMVESSIDAVFERDRGKAAWVVTEDAAVDRVDIEIEQRAVRLMGDIANESVNLHESKIRMLLTIVKINNELERIADISVNIAEQFPTLLGLPKPPTTFRVMANSIIGIVRDANTAFETMDIPTARSVLASDDLVDAFELRILREAQEEVARGVTPVEVAFGLMRVATDLERIGDHCTNIAEQVIYVATGAIVRHQEGHWSAPEMPEMPGL
jgi:phosphate transport system protein